MFKGNNNQRGFMSIFLVISGLIIFLEIILIILLMSDLEVVIKACEFSFDKDDKELFALRKLDVDILSLDIIEHDEEQFEPQKKLYDLVRHENPSGKDYGISIFSKHRNDKGEDVVFRFLERESEGTKRLAVVVAVILHALSVGGIVFFDEFDRSLHPLLVRELLTLFQKELYNPNGAQLCFATHCTDILDDSVLRMSEIGIVLKNIRTGTIIRRLIDMKNGGAEIRNVTNFRKQYLDGFYSGIPYPAL